MKLLSNIKIGKRLYISFFIVLCLASLGGVVGAVLLKNSDTEYSKALENYGFSQGDVAMLMQRVTEAKAIVADATSKTSEEDWISASERMKELYGMINDSFIIVEEKLGKESTEDRELIATVKSLIQLFQTQFEEMKTLQLDKEIMEGQKLYDEKVVPTIESAISNCNELVENFKETGILVSERLTTQSGWTILIIVVIIVVATLISIFFATIISRGISKLVNEIVDVAKEIAQGNLEVTVSQNSGDELGMLANAFRETIRKLKSYINDITNNLVEVGNGDLTGYAKVEYEGAFIIIRETTEKIVKNLNHTLHQIDTASGMVSSGSDQIAAAGQAMSQGAMEQASAVEELNATLYEVSEQIQKNADDAKGASEKATSVGRKVEDSNQKMDEMILAMEEISKSSKQIEAIMKTIEDIASQTNMLSLNASIEAARAGEAGRGFAVVATQIGELANQSAKAVHNTNTLIETSIHAVSNGTRIVGETANALHVVVDGARQVVQGIENIAFSTVGQAESVRELLKAVDQISGVVQSNSATAEESAAASQELAGQAQTLQGLIQEFKLK